MSNAKVNEQWFNLHEPEIYTWLLDKYDEKPDTGNPRLILTLLAWCNSNFIKNIK